MNNNQYSLAFGGFSLRYFFIFSETARYFDGYLSECAEDSSQRCIRVTREFMEECRWLVSEDEESLPFLEFQTLMLATGNTLPASGRALFHAAALLWKGKAWLISAPSGTGKTTQLRHWRDLLKREVKIINGDKPFLECRNDGSVWIYSSPWRGKEKFGVRGQNAPLGGIILLKQGKENHMERIDPGEAVMPLFRAFISCPETTEQIRCQARILDHMLDAVPVWRLTNLGDTSSALLTHETLNRYLEETS